MSTEPFQIGITQPLNQITSALHVSDAICLVRMHPPSIGEGPYIVAGGVTRIGRVESADLILEGGEISRQHAEIERSASALTIRDCGSQNGTFVNGERVDALTPLSNGDLIRVGKVVLKCLIGDSVEQQSHEALYKMMIADGLTGVANKRYFLETLDREISRARRRGRSICLALIDIDHFKRINDSYGHLAGDDILRGVCERIAPVIREDEMLARYGGEEFAILLPEAAIENARKLCERILDVIRATPSWLGSTRSPSLSVSASPMWPWMMLRRHRH